MEKDDLDWVGYFESPYQTTPSHDPGLKVLCPVCLHILAPYTLTTISLMKPTDERSYFFRAHKQCWDEAGSEKQSAIESSIIDGSIDPGAVMGQ